MSINEEFCKLVGIKKVNCTYFSNGKIKYGNTKTVKEPLEIFEEKYPELNKGNNFLKLINIQWELFGQLGNSYERQGKESFQDNYILLKTQAIRMAKDYGGGEMLDEYIKKVRNTNWEY